MKIKLSLMAVLISQVTTTDCMFTAARAVFPYARAVVATARPIAREAFIKARPAFEKVKEHAHPTVKKGIAWAKANPKQALGAGVGTVVGYKTSGDGVVNTSVGMATGACTGLFLTGAQTIKYKILLENQMAMATARESVFASELAAAKAGGFALKENLAALGAQAAALKNRVATLKQALRGSRATTTTFKNKVTDLERVVRKANRGGIQKPVIIQTPAAPSSPLTHLEEAGLRGMRAAKEAIERAKNSLAGLINPNLAHA